jgi:fido (protein-threonine AMPylation protein)
MSRYSDNDPYLDPATGVLKNRLGITDEATLEKTEADLVAARSFELSKAPLKGNFDLVHLQAIHRHLFGDVYEWAGELFSWGFIETGAARQGQSVYAGRQPERTD